MTRVVPLGRWLTERRALVGWWAGSRLLVLMAVLALHWLRVPRGYFGTTLFRDPMHLLGSWDGVWYRTIAEHGYILVPGRPSDPAFFPLYAVVLRGFEALGLPVLTAGILFSNLMLLAGVLALYELSREFFDRADARRAAIYASVFPLGYVFSMEYPQSFVLAAMVLAGLFAMRGRWALAAVAAAVAGLTRPEAVFLALPLADAARRQWPGLPWPDRRRAVAAVLAAPAAFASFPLYLWWALHDVHAWGQAQAAWGRSFAISGPWRALVELWHSPSTYPWLLRDGIFAAVYVLLLWLALRAGAPRGWVLAGVLIVLIPLASGSFTSVGRFGLLALPVYWGLAVLARRRCFDWALRILALGLLATATYLLPVTFP